MILVPIAMKSYWRIAAALLISGCSLASCAHAPQPDWDVASIIGQPIDIAKQKLGPPQKEALPPGNTATVPNPAPTAQSTWQTGATTLTANWKPDNKRVISWTLTHPDADAVRDDAKESLLKPLHLQASDSRYDEDWIEATDRPLFYSSVRVIPTPKTHAVILRVTGGSALIEVTYQISGPQAQNQTIMTIAPWETPFSLPDDTQIQFKSRVLQPGDGGSSNMKVEILADNKVIASDTSTGRPVACQTEL